MIKIIIDYHVESFEDLFCEYECIESIYFKSITAASGKSIEEMLKEYTAACLFEKPKYGFNVALDKSDYTVNNYSYPLDSVNLWGLNTLLPKS